MGRPGVLLSLRKTRNLCTLNNLEFLKNVSWQTLKEKGGIRGRGMQEAWPTSGTVSVQRTARTGF